MSASKEDMIQFLNALIRNNEEERMSNLVGYDLAEKADEILDAILDIVEQYVIS